MTPAGTLISVNQVFSIYFGTTISQAAKYAFGELNISDNWLRVMSITFLSLALVVIFKRARLEWRSSRRHSSDDLQDEGASYMEQWDNGEATLFEPRTVSKVTVGSANAGPSSLLVGSF